MFGKNRVGIITTIEMILFFFNIKFTRRKLLSFIENHLDYPSLLSVKDTLEEYGIQSAAIRKGDYQYSDFEIPFVCLIQRSSWSNAEFVLVKDVGDETISYFDPVERVDKIDTLLFFEKLDKGIVLLLDPENRKDEHDYVVNRKKEIVEAVISKFPYFSIAIFTVFSLIYQFSSSYNWLSILFTITAAIGFGFSFLLIWRELDEHNPFLKEVCGGKGKKINCDAVLHSKGAKLFGVSWSVWGAGFFSTFYLFQLLFVGQDANILVWSILSLLISPYIIYSIYYQSVVIRQWCPLCLGIQAILFVNAISSFMYLSDISSWSIHWYTIAIAFFVGILLLYCGQALISILKDAKESKEYRKQWKKLKYNLDIFNSLLRRNERIISPVNGLGIVVGNPMAEREVVKVCNPYCGPCSKAHAELEFLIDKNPNIRLRVIFMATGNDSDIMTPPVRHFMGIEEKYGSLVVKQALDDWYLSENKDYSQFASKYPLNGELDRQLDKMTAMRSWCDNMKIRATPTFFIDGYEMPEGYDISELKYFL